MKKLLSLVLVFSFCLSLASCAKTPEAPVVMQKDQEQLVETAKGANQTTDTICQQTKAPAHLTEKSPKNTDTFSVSIDADIELPETDMVKILRVGCHFITQEEVDGWIHTLFGDNTLYTPDSFQQKTKSDLQADLISMKQVLSQVENSENPEDALGFYGSVAELEEDIALTEAEIEVASETRTLHEASSQLQMGMLNAATQTEDGSFLSIEISDADSEYQTASLLYRKLPAEYGGTSGIMILTESDLMENWSDNKGMLRAWDSIPQTTITQEQAQSSGDAFLKGLNLSDYCVVKSTPAFCTKFSDRGNVPGRHGWKLEYRRKVNEIPVLWTFQDRSFSTYSAAWMYEKLTLFVSDDGVMQWQMDAPYDVRESLSENSKLLEFDRIMEIFYQMLPIFYEEYYAEGGASVIHEEFSVNRIVFGYSRIVEQNQSFSGLLIPTWSFYGTDTNTIENDGEEFSTTIPERDILTINAIDGSIIDTVKGY